MNPALPGDLTSPTAGALLRRGAPVFWRDEETRYVVTLDPFREADATCWGVLAAPDTWPCIGVWDDAGNFTLDLDDPAGMDLAARWLARHHGLTVGATAPGWRRAQRGDHTWAWVLAGDFGSVWFSAGRFNSDIVVPGISALTDPAAALALACLHAGGRQ